MNLISQFQAARATSKEVDAEFTHFFRRIGYTVGLEGRQTPFELWHEIFDDGRLVLQVKTGTPIVEFLADLPHLVEGRPGVRPTDYWLACKDNDQLRELIRRVKETADAPA